MGYWAVARCAPHNERLAAASVVAAGFEIFVPRIRVKAIKRWKTLWLFPCYFFCRIEGAWRPIERSPGVRDVVKFGITPAPMPDAEIAKLLARADADGIIRLNAQPTVERKHFEAGENVRIIDGPFKGLDAVDAGRSGHDRVAVLRNVLGGPTKVANAAHLGAPAA